MDLDFKVPSTIPQDLLFIQDLIGNIPISTVTIKHISDSDSVASSSGEVESEDEVEADLVPGGEDSEISVAASDSASESDSEPDDAAGPSSESEDGDNYEEHQQQRITDNVGDEESGIPTTAAYPQTKNEIADADIMVPTISEVEPCDTLEKVGEIMSIVGNIVIVRGLPANHVESLSGHTLDAESLLVFEDRKVLGYIYETFGPTSQPLYQVKFNQRYPLDTDKVWLLREVFHVPQRSHFVFVDQLERLRGSDASNIHDEEPADDEIEFSDDEKEAAFRAERKRRRGHSVSSSRQSTPAPFRVFDDMVQDRYHGSNPYDAHGPYDDDYQVTGPSRPLPAPYDDPYADSPTSDIRAQRTDIDIRSRGEHKYRRGRDPIETSRGHSFGPDKRGSRARSHRLRNTPKRGHDSTASRRALDSSRDPPFPVTSQTFENATSPGQRNVLMPHTFFQPPPNAWLPPGTNNVSQPFIQPHINPRFASMFGLDLSSGSIPPWTPQDECEYEYPSPYQRWAGTWATHSGAGSEGEGDTYKPM